MYKENVLCCLTQTILIETSIDFKRYSTLFVNKMLNELGSIFSFIIYANYERDVLISYTIRVHLSQSEEFNTILPCIASDTILHKIFKHYDNDEKKYVVGYGQPSLDNIVKWFDPLIQRLSKELKQRWTFLELEDLQQMCRLVISDLYYKGYYIHKRLVYKAFNNYVLMHIRKDKLKPETISLEQEWAKTDDDDFVTIGDMIPDNSMCNEMEDKENNEIEQHIINEMKSIIVDFIGPRQYDQLLREYGNKSTTAWSRKLMLKIKAHLFEMGINCKSFAKYYE